MKIVILSDIFDDCGGRGSATPTIRNFAAALKDRGHEVSFITTAQTKEAAFPRKIDGVMVYPIYSNYNLLWRAYVSLYNRQTIGTIKKIIGEIKPDIVHAHHIHLHLSYHSLKIAKGCGAKVFLTAHDTMHFHYGKLIEMINPDDPNVCDLSDYKISAWQQFRRYGKTYNPLRNLIIRHYLKYPDKIFTISNALQKALADNGIKTSGVVYNGINANDWLPNNELIEEFKSKYGLRSKKIILLGQMLSETKGSREACTAIKRIIKEVQETVLLATGYLDKDADKQMLDFAKELGIEKNVIIIKNLEGDWLKAAFFASNVVIVPSVYFDALPRINLEAMAAKKPVVGTCLGGTKEVVIDGETGFIVNPFNTEQLAERIIDLLKNPEKAQKFGKAGYERVKNEFNLEKMVNDYLMWYIKPTETSN